MIAVTDDIHLCLMALGDSKLLVRRLDEYSIYDASGKGNVGRLVRGPYRSDYGK